MPEETIQLKNICVECGREFEITLRQKHKKRCGQCAVIVARRQNREYTYKKREQKKNHLERN